jgi:uncharacterized protein YjiS (DUF1127 family)
MESVVYHSLANYQPRRRQAGRGGTIVKRAAMLALVWWKRVRERGELSALTERDLKDMGLTRADALGEIAKPFWRD